jgi:hypothetical protein
MLICAAFAYQLPPPSQGTITGTVSNEAGVPVAGAKVSADPLDHRLRISPVTYVITDTRGRFKVERLAWGEYAIFADKEEAGYPNSRLAFYSDDKFPAVVLSESTPTTVISVRLKRAATLKGRISDADTKIPTGASFRLTRLEKPADWIATSVPSDYRVLIPPDVDVGVEATSRGYNPWPSPGLQRKIRLHPGQTMTLNIDLKPEVKPYNPSSRR